MESVFFSMGLSLQVALIATLLSIFFGCAFAYILSRRDLPGKDLLDVLLMLPLVLPPTVTGYMLVVLFGAKGLLGRPIYDLTGYSLMFTWQAAVLCSFIVSMPLMLRTAKASFESVDNNLVQASYLMGYSELHTFFRIILPLSRRGLYAGTVLSFARALGEFGATLMLAGNIEGRTDTMPLAIYSDVTSGDWSKAWGMVLLFTVISAIFLYTANKLAARQRWV